MKRNTNFLGLNLQTVVTQGTVSTLTLLNATSTAGNPTRHATSSPLLIAGAKQVTFQVSVSATSTVSGGDIRFYVSSDTETPATQSKSAAVGNYIRYYDLILPSTTTPAVYTNNHLDSRYGELIVSTLENKGATTTATMDLSRGTWRSLFVVASSSPHSPITIKATIEY